MAALKEIDLDRSRWFLAIGVLASAVLTAGSASAAARPDLVEVSIARPPATIAAGMSLTLKDVVKNRGGTGAWSSATGYYLSPDQVRNKSDVRLGRRNIPRLGSGKSSTGTRKITVPATTPLGRYFVLACADDRKDVRESNERNNCRSSAKRMRVKAPTPCQEQLITLGHGFALGPSKKGVVDPITIDTPINGIEFTSNGGMLNTKLFMDCTLALAMDRVTDDLVTRGIGSVGHFGIYNYRCIGAGNPDDGCPNGVSQHAYATAMDFATFTGEDATYSVLDDWVGTPADDDTCTATPANPEDQFLHDVVCYWYDANIFNIILTPNYNADHDNHFHADLTPGADFME